MTYRGIVAAIILIASTLVSGCVPMGGTDFPEATAGFTPKTTYAVSTDRAFHAVIAALNANSIPIVNASQATGQITTDYLAGKGQLGLLSADHTRYKYSIFIIAQGRGHTSINVSCSLEITQYTGDTSTQYHDVSSENAERITGLRNWLYQKIEQQLAQ